MNMTGMKIALTISLIFCMNVQSRAQGYQYKGAYLYQFARIFDWPDASSDFTIIVYGDSEIKPVLDKIAATKTVGSRAIVVKKVNSLDALNNCQIVFVPVEGMNSLSKIKSYAEGKNLLVVTESKSAANSGAGINFKTVNGKILFEINKGNITKSGMKLPLSLERLAHKVY